MRVVHAHLCPSCGQWWTCASNACDVGIEFARVGRRGYPRAIPVDCACSAKCDGEAYQEYVAVKMAGELD